ncbi:unnamed protein product [Lactuca saligna]|uniref:D-isomer specific 2-hydroxyacid dehydrogenase NAD-binding domain-containing protein n=1 Tax=Lactuca saligna TaxID=75948 RepID=A0AA35XXZ1_LACSI|nr:unnamed protein product [Lactuca saligna]
MTKKLASFSWYDWRTRGTNKRCQEEVKIRLISHCIVELASHCDILVVACALTVETRHIINCKVIDALGPNGFLINIERGPHIDEPELVSALVERQIAGAGLDVFENEPHVPEKHFGVETVKAMADLVVGNLEAHFSKKPLLRL